MNDAGPAAAALVPQAVPRLAPGLRLQWEPAQNAHVLLYPEGMVRLNGSAGEILVRCDGRRTLGEVVAELEAAFATAGLERDVFGFVELALRQRWLRLETGSAAAVSAPGPVTGSAGGPDAAAQARGAEPATEPRR
ncbi:coenzyme PQQ synthesis protein D [Piscinibacter sakaiensis]|uniref:PqqA binding protein n=1 Tax=Piscinibacter sakaiensis TaxID=1547922 RepID=A0A0K8PA16_PISS1|nr:coenzyme PQQ synthesis protein D [Piscinibacter sakaiensis]